MQRPHLNELNRLRQVEAVYGSFSAETQFRDFEMLSHSRRLAGSGLPSSMLSLEVLMGIEDKLQFGQFPHRKSDSSG